jgi:hypothetical protein
MTDAIEIKKHAYRQTQDGIVISFVMHPNDVPDRLAVAPLGTRYYAALVDADEYEASGAEPVNPAADSAASAAQTERKCSEDRVNPNLPPHEPQQDSGSAGVKRRPAQQAGWLCKEPSFQRYLFEMHGCPERTPEAAAEFVRTWCSVISRAEIVPGTHEARLWRELYEGFLAWQRYPEIVG